MTDPLRPLWDFDDLDATEARFRALRAEALTQLARVQGLREDYDGGDRLLDEVAEEDPRVRIRVDLERGRLRRSSGDKEAALPLFERAFEAAVEAGEDWLAATRRTWPRSRRRTATASSPGRTAGSSWPSRSEAAAYWAGPLLNNLGWEHFDAEEYEQALDAFERALASASGIRRTRPRSSTRARRSPRRGRRSAGTRPRSASNRAGVVERPDHGEVRPVLDDLLRDALDVLGGDGVERVEHGLRLLGASLRAPRAGGRT